MGFLLGWAKQNPLARISQTGAQKAQKKGNFVTRTSRVMTDSMVVNNTTPIGHT
jgi:hypothetical protein